ADAPHGLLEELAVLGLSNRDRARPDELDAEALEGSGIVEGEREIEGGLSPERRQKGIRPIAFEDRSQRRNIEGLDVRALRELRIRHDGGRIGVDEDDVVALGKKSLGALSAGVVELASLADDDGAGSDE